MNVYLAEFIGTAIIIFFGGGVVANVSLTKSKAQGGNHSSVGFRYNYSSIYSRLDKWGTS